MIKAVIFDMDGVIIDSEIEYVRNVQNLLKGHGVEVPLEDLYYLGGGANTFYSANIAKFLKVPEDIAAAYYKQFNIDHPTDFLSLLRPEAVTLLKELKQKDYKIALASSSTMKRIDLKLDACDIRSYFDLTVSGVDFPKTKPDPRVFLHVAEQFKLKPEECMVIEDSRMGIDGGHNAGMYVVALYDPRFKFDTGNATTVVDNLDEVAGLLEALNA